MKPTSVFLVLMLLVCNFASAQYKDYELLDTKTDHRTAVESLTLAPDGVTMISGHHDGYLVTWDLSTMTMKKEVKAHGGEINTILFDKSGKRFVTSGEDGKIVLWSFPSMKKIEEHRVPPERNSFAVISPDGRYIYFGGANSRRPYDRGYSEPYGGMYRVKIGENRRAELVFDNEQGGSYGSNITDGNLDYTGKYVVFTKKYYMYFFNIEDLKIDFKVSSYYSLNNLTCTKDAIFVWGDGQLMRYDKDRGRYSLYKKTKAGIHSASAGYSKIVVSGNGKYMATGDDGNYVNIWDTDRMEKVQSLKGHTDVVRNFLFWNNDSVLITAGYDGKLMVWGYKPKPEDKDTVEIVEVVDTVKQDTVPKQIDVVFDEDNIPLTTKDRPVEKQGTFYVKSEEFEIEIWDNSVYDHDVISLNINGEWILNNYEVTKEKKKVKIHVKPNTNNYLILYAHNLGEISPNTAAVGLRVNGKLQRLTVKSDLKKCGALNFEYKPE